MFSRGGCPSRRQVGDPDRSDRRQDDDDTIIESRNDGIPPPEGEVPQHPRKDGQGKEDHVRDGEIREGEVQDGAEVLDAPEIEEDRDGSGGMDKEGDVIEDLLPCEDGQEDKELSDVADEERDRGKDDVVDVVSIADQHRVLAHEVDHQDDGQNPEIEILLLPAQGAEAIEEDDSHEEDQKE